MSQQFKVSHLTWASLSDSVPRLVSPVRYPDAPLFVMTDTAILLVALLNGLLIIAAVGVAWFGSRRPVAGRLALGTAVAMVLGAPAYLVMLFLTLHQSIWIPGRYGLSLLPAAAAVLAVAAGHRKFGGTALVVLGAVSTVVLLSATIT